MTQKQKEKLIAQKLKALEDQGLTPPKDETERKQMLKDAHGF